MTVDGPKAQRCYLSLPKTRPAICRGFQNCAYVCVPVIGIKMGVILAESPPKMRKSSLRQLEKYKSAASSLQLDGFGTLALFA